MNHSNDRQPATLSMAEQVVLWCMKHGYPISVLHTLMTSTKVSKSAFVPIIPVRGSNMYNQELVACILATYGIFPMTVAEAYEYSHSSTETIVGLGGKAEWR